MKKITTEQFIKNLSPEHRSDFFAVMAHFLQTVIMPEMEAYKSIPGYVGEYDNFFKLNFSTGLTKYFCAECRYQWDGDMIHAEAVAIRVFENRSAFDMDRHKVNVLSTDSYVLN